MNVSKETTILLRIREIILIVWKQRNIVSFVMHTQCTEKQRNNIVAK